MNLFILDDDVNRSAKKLRQLDKIRFNKQIVELTQMLAQNTDLRLPKQNGDYYRQNKSLSNHPASIWVNNNRKYCIIYLLALLKVYKECTNKEHGCTPAANVLKTTINNEIELTPKLGWFTKKVHYTSLGRDIIEATGIYLMAKQVGFYSNQ